MAVPSADYWTLAQAVAWVCTRNRASVEAISEPLSGPALQTQLLKFLAGQKRIVRKFSSGQERISLLDVGEGKFDTGGCAIWQLQMAILQGCIRTILRDVRSGSSGEIPGKERIDLEFRIVPDDPIRPYGFWSKKTGECRWIEPLLLTRDLQLLAPAPKQSPTDDVKRRIYARLLEITANGPLKRDDAFEKCEDVPGSSVRTFGAAWKELPSNRKFGPGKHGPRRHLH